MVSDNICGSDGWIGRVGSTVRVVGDVWRVGFSAYYKQLTFLILKKDTVHRTHEVQRCDFICDILSHTDTIGQDLMLYNVLCPSAQTSS